MEEIKVRAIVVDCKEHKEKDKIITLLTVNGFVQAKLRSVKTNTAKLKLAKEIFCFADFILSGNTEYPTVIAVDIIDNFFDITKDYDRYCLGANAVKYLKIIAKNENNPNLLINLVKCLQFLTYDFNINPVYIYDKFLIEILSQIGYKLNLTKCSNCGGQFVVKTYLEPTGEMHCMACKSAFAVEVDKVVQSALRILSNTNYEDLKNIKLSKGSENKVQILLENNILNIQKY